MKPHRIVLLLAALLGLGVDAKSTVTGVQPEAPLLDDIAEEFVRLVLAVGQHDPDYVDAYLGPPEWKEEAARTSRSLADLGAAATALEKRLQTVEPTLHGSTEGQRFRYLEAQIRSVGNRISLLSGHTVPFDEETRLLYDTVLPDFASGHFESIRTRIDHLLPGEGPLVDRVVRFQERFVVPREKVEVVMRAAVAECRRRTLDHVALPEHEGFKLEFVTGQPWNAYNWYRGNAQSVIQINLDLPFRLEKAINLAAHEGYPGHHVQGTLHEIEFVGERGWREWQVYPLFSPRSVVDEGVADFGIEVAFPPNELAQFGRDVLFPLAGLDPAEATRYFEVTRLLGLKLQPLRSDIARRYLDGKLGADEAVTLLSGEGLLPRAEALKALDFARRYRGYLVTYDSGYTLVKRYVETHGGTTGNPNRRWELFLELTRTRTIPSALR